MHFTKVVPSIFYTDIRIALKTFIDCLEFTLRPWGAREFAMLDGQIGIRVQQWNR